MGKYIIHINFVYLIVLITDLNQDTTGRLSYVCNGIMRFAINEIRLIKTFDYGNMENKFGI